MKYGFFDDANREYVITRPDTPAPWANYLGSPEYGALISNNAGGYSFVKSGANGRILRYVFNQFDQPGRYLYLRDNADGDFWSASWQPVGKDLSQYRSECRHGMGYTKMRAEYRGIRSEAVYYVPMGKSMEVWLLTVENRSAQRRELTLTGYAEFTSNSNYEQDQVNLQYSMFITRTLYDAGRIRQQLHGNLDAVENAEGVDHKIVTERFFGLTGAGVSSYCGERAAFLGPYRGFRDPVGVERGDLGGTLNYNGNSCGALSTVVALEPGEKKTVAFVLGEKGAAESAAILRDYADPETVCEQELAALRADWDAKLSRFRVKTPSPEFDTMLNIWNAYNCFMTFTWSRAASFTYCGLRNGYGYRDTVQDIQGVIHLSPTQAAEKIRFMLSAQVDHGGALPLVKFTHNAGHEDTPEDESYVRETGHPSYRADDALWLFPTVYKYVAETGDLKFLDEMVPFANRGEGTVYEHLKRALTFSRSHLGPHGMPAGLYADWNDCLRLGANGESSFVAFQYYYAYTVLRAFAREKGDAAYLARLEAEQAALREKLAALCWNEDRFIRGFTEAGETIGERTAPEANLWLNPQSWAVISGLADEAQAEAAMRSVDERLNTPYGAVLMDPPYHAHAFEGLLSVIYNAGVKENAGIFSQSQGWLILAEALLGHGGRAYRVFCENAPSMQNDRAEVRCLEPYCYGQFTEGPASPRFGRSHVHWLTGTASTVMVGCVEGILGVRPTLRGIKIAPAIPKEWQALEIEKEFRGKRLHIVVENPDGKESGCASLTVNGAAVEGNEIPEALLAGCGGSGSSTSGTAAPAGGSSEGKIINIYSWNNEFQTRVEAVYDKVDHTSDDGTVTYLTDGCEIHWVINPNTNGVYQQKLDEALLKQGAAAADDKVDMFLSETDYVVKYTDADVDVAIPLKDLGINPDTDLAEQYDYTKVVASDANGVQRGSTWQGCPCLLAYRRDIAKDVFGTDDPDAIAAICADWGKMKDAAAMLKDKGYFTFACYADTFRSYGNSVSAPWVTTVGSDVVLTVDPRIMEWISDSKEWLDAGYFDKTIKGQWNDDWNKAMGSKSSVFAFLFPAWGIDFVLNPNWDGEPGSWGVTTGPQAFNWGGSFIHGCTGTDNPEHVREIILALTGNNENMDKITREYTEFTNNRGVMNAIAKDETFGTEFLGGENPFKYFAPAAEGITMTTLSPYDQGCVELIQSCFGDYFQGQVDFERAKVNFETAIRERYPDITQVVWPS